MDAAAEPILLIKSNCVKNRDVMKRCIVKDTIITMYAYEKSHEPRGRKRGKVVRCWVVSQNLSGRKDIAGKKGGSKRVIYSRRPFFRFLLLSISSLISAENF
jgi:hypothetical protein